MSLDKKDLDQFEALLDSRYQKNIRIEEDNRKERQKRSNGWLYGFLIGCLYAGLAASVIIFVFYYGPVSANVTIVQGSLTTYQHCTIAYQITNGTQSVKLSRCSNR